MEAKQFGMSFEETLAFANRYPEYAAIVEVRVPTVLLQEVADFTRVDTFIFNSGTVTIPYSRLTEFNRAIQQIEHAF